MKIVTLTIIIVTFLVSIISFRNDKWFFNLSFKPFRIKRYKEWYRFITHGFVHANYGHLILNMLVFFSFGIYVEDFFSERIMPVLPFLGLYLGGIIVASIYDYFKKRNDPYYTSIGASGAVSAVLFTSILVNPWGTIYFYFIPCPGIVMGVLYLVYCQYMAKRNRDHQGYNLNQGHRDNIDHYAHFYGALWGLVYPILIDPKLFTEFIRLLLRQS